MGNKLVYGVGVNDSKEPVTKKVNGVRTWVDPAYRSWTGMLSRCYCKSTQHNQPYYVGSTVCEEWLKFSNFKEWFNKQDWQGKFLTKDIVNGVNSVYSPENCAFVTRHVSGFLADFDNHGENDAVGVHERPTGFVATCRNPVKRDSGYLGVFKTKEEAQRAYMTKKAEYCLLLANIETNGRVRKALESLHEQWVLSGFINY